MTNSSIPQSNLGEIALKTKYQSNIERSQIELNSKQSARRSGDDSAIERLKREIIALKTENARLQQENEMVKKDLDIAKQVIRRAKDVTPLMRISLKRVLRLAHDACMDIQRSGRGWILKMGSKARRFRRLADIWDILSQDEWYLSEIFPEDKLIALDMILPPRPRKKSAPPEKKTYPLISRAEVLFRRRMGMPKCC